MLKNTVIWSKQKEKFFTGPDLPREMTKYDSFLCMNSISRSQIMIIGFQKYAEERKEVDGRRVAIFDLFAKKWQTLPQFLPYFPMPDFSKNTCSMSVVITKNKRR